MRMSYPIMATIAATLLLGSCSTTGQSTGPSTIQTASNFINRQHIVTVTPIAYPPKNPKQVALFTPDKAPHAAYRVIGVATVSKYNALGMKRHDETMSDMMKSLAASIGGDGLINVNSNDEAMEAKVIAFQKILL